MNAFRKFTFKRRIAVAVCVIFACLSFIAGLIVFNNENPSKYNGGGTLNKVTDTVEPDVKPEIKAFFSCVEKMLRRIVYKMGQFQLIFL